MRGVPEITLALVWILGQQKKSMAKIPPSHWKTRATVEGLEISNLLQSGIN